jgi:hypothetical protein
LLFCDRAQSLHYRRGMSRMTRWIVSVTAGIAALPAAYAANLLICDASPIGNLAAVANALTLIP